MNHQACNLLKAYARRIEHPCVERADAGYDYLKLTPTTQAGRITLSIAFVAGVSQDGFDLDALVRTIDQQFKEKLSTPPTLVGYRYCDSGRQVLSRFHVTWEFGPESKEPKRGDRSIGFAVETAPGTPIRPDGSLPVGPSGEGG